jgi:hypothetical protein
MSWSTWSYFAKSVGDKQHHTVSSKVVGVKSWYVEWQLAACEYIITVTAVRHLLMVATCFKI